MTAEEHAHVQKLEGLVKRYHSRIAALKAEASPRVPAATPAPESEDAPCSEGCLYCSGEACMFHGNAECDCDVVDRHTDAEDREIWKSVDITSPSGDTWREWLIKELLDLSQFATDILTRSKGIDRYRTGRGDGIIEAVDKIEKALKHCVLSSVPATERPAPTWQPIESAPKDEVIVTFGPDGVNIGDWWEWGVFGGTWTDDRGNRIAPTHFMRCEPLPSAPPPHSAAKDGE